MLLYDSGLSGNCYKVRLLFAQLGIDYERREVDVINRSGRSELLGTLNPALRVPTLELDDRRSLGESNAILWYFGDGTEFVPEDRFERAQVLQWQFFEQYQPRAVHRGRALLGDRRNRAVPGGRRRQAPGRRGGAESDGGLAIGSRVPRRRAYTLADISLYAYTHVAPEGGFPLEPYPAIRAWLERIAAQPGHVPTEA